METTAQPRKRRNTKRRRDDAQALAAYNEQAAKADTAGKREQRRRIEATIRTITRNLEGDPTDVANPRSSAAAKVRMLTQLADKLAAL